jgi:hypothetical protein
MSDDLNSSLDYLWGMLTEQGLYMEANIIALAQNRIEELEAKSRKRLSAVEAMGLIKMRYKETLEYLRSSNRGKP